MADDENHSGSGEDEPELDAEEEEDEEDVEEEDKGKSGSSNKKRKPDEVDEDDDDEDEEEPQVRGGKKRKKKKDAGINDPKYFLDLEAEVDEDEAEEEDEDEGGLIQPDDVLSEDEEEALKADEQRRKYRQSLMNLQDEDINEEALNQRYSSYYQELDEPENEGYEERSDIRQQSYLPTVKDPKLWMIRCKMGQESLTAISILQKCVERERDGERLLIKSVVAPPHLKGTIYVEAEKEAHVRAAILGLRALFSWQLQLVPIPEMVHILRIPDKEFTLKKNAWVRMKRGHYKGDVAQVVEADETRGKYTVKLIPRIDLVYQLKYSQYKAALNDQKQGKTPVDPNLKPPQKPKVIPQKFFNPEEVRQMGLERSLEERRDASAEKFIFFGPARFKDGYMYKTVTLQGLEVANVVPTLEELQKFQNKGQADEDDDDLETLARARVRRKTTFAKGDSVKVIEGDLKHLQGTVESVQDDTVTIMPKHQDLKDLLTFPAGQLQKAFKVGDHCKVIGGRFDGDVGLVVSVDDNVVVLFSDQTQKEIKVLSHDLQLCSEVTTGRLELGNYELHDLVQLDAQTVGMIVRIERDAFKVLDNSGNMRTVKLQEMGPKRNARNPQAFDSTNSPIGIGDVVQVLDGKYKGRQGTIKHLYRFYAYLWARDLAENSGIFVERTTNLAVLGGPNKFKPRAAPGFAPVNQPLASPGSLLAAGRGNEGGGRSLGRGGRGAGAPGRGGGPGMAGRGRGLKDPLVNKTVVIRGPSPWKGYVGIVKDVTGDNARVELHTNCKTITINKNLCQEERRDAHERVGASASSSLPGHLYGTHMPPRTPSYADGSRTPMRDEVATPMGINTPTWNPDQPNTPRAETPAWNEESAGWTPANEGYPSLPTPGTAASAYSPYGYQEHVHTPAAESHTPITPGESLTPRTPQAATPFVPTTPGTPAAAEEHHSHLGASDSGSSRVDASARDWHTVDIEVRVIAGPGQLLDKKGVIRELRANDCGIAFADRADLTFVSRDSLEPVVPAKKDKIKLIRGELRGYTGNLVGIDGNDGIVKMDAGSSSGDIKILNMHDLARYVPRAD